jgi:hypothetical protein
MFQQLEFVLELMEDQIRRERALEILTSARGRQNVQFATAIGRALGGSMLMNRRNYAREESQPLRQYYTQYIKDKIVEYKEQIRSGTIEGTPLNRPEVTQRVIEPCMALYVFNQFCHTKIVFYLLLFMH